MTATALSTKEVGFEYLNGQQRAFAIAWVKYHDSVKALEEAGYALTDNPSRAAYKLRRRCGRMINYLEDTALREARIDIAEIQQEYAKMGFANPLNYVVALPDGGHRPKTLMELTRAEAAAISSFILLPMDFGGKKLLVLTEIEFHSKIKALEGLCKTMGIGVKPAPGTTTPQANPYDLSRLPTAQLSALEGILRAAANTVSDARDKSAIPGESSGAGGQQSKPSGRPA